MWKKVDCISEIRIKSSFDKYNKVFYIYIYIVEKQVLKQAGNIWLTWIVPTIFRIEFICIQHNSSVLYTSSKLLWYVPVPQFFNC